jgi:nucleoid-associated protein YgaU
MIKFDEVEKLAAQSKDGSLDFEQVTTTIINEEGSLSFQALKANQAYFESLDPVQQVLYVRTILTVEDTLDTSEFNAFMAKNPALTRQLMEGRISGADARAAYIQSTTEKIVGSPRQSFGSDADASEPTGGGGGGKSGPDASILDPIVKSMRDYINLQQKATVGWEASLDAIIKFGKSAAKSFNGLANQLRNVKVPESLIEKFLGMDPDEWDRRKNELFTFDVAGNVTGMTSAGQDVSEAFNQTTIAQYIDQQRSLSSATEDQVEAIKKLRAAGLDFETAYQIVQDTALATAIATEKNVDRIKELAKEAKKAKRLVQQIEEDTKKDSSAKSVKDANKDFKKRQQAVRKMGQEAGNYSREQMDAILNDPNLMELFLDPTIDPKAFDRAMKRIQDQAKLEIEITQMTMVGDQLQNVSNIETQMAAFDILSDAGASFEVASALASDSAIAAAIAAGATKESVQALVEAAEYAAYLQEQQERRAREAQRKTAARDSVRDMNDDFERRSALLARLQEQGLNFTEEQLELLLSNENVATLFLDPDIDPNAFAIAMNNAMQAAEQAFQERIMTTAGRAEVVSEGFGMVWDRFAAMEQELEIKFKAEISGQDQIIKDAEAEIAKINYVIEDYQAGLTEISRQEDIINEAYDKRFDALDKISDINGKIARQQQGQLSLAEALSRGDIAAAAQAAQQMRNQQQSDSVADQKKMLEQRKRLELEQVKSTAGFTRKELEDQIKALEEEVFRIEQERVRPAAEYVRLAELRLDAEKEALTVLDKTREQWETIENQVDLARTSSWQFVKDMIQAVGLIDSLIEKYGELEPPPGFGVQDVPATTPPPPPPATTVAPPPPRTTARTTTPRPTTTPPPPPTTPKPKTYTVKPGDTLSGIARRFNIANWRDLYNLNRSVVGPNPNRIFPGQVLTIPKRAMGGLIPYRPMGGKIPYKVSGGLSKALSNIFPPLGSDTIPTMLTPGEFVIRRPAVNQFGLDRLESINRGTYADGSMYNYNVQINVKSDSSADQIAHTVMREIKRIDSKRIRGNRI